MEILPFKEEQISENVYIRTFSNEVSENVLKWHWDGEDREVEVIGETDWEFQRDNELPAKMEGVISIPKGQWHRIIKGTGSLKIRVTKF